MTIWKHQTSLLNHENTLDIFRRGVWHSHSFWLNDGDVRRCPSFRGKNFREQNMTRVGIPISGYCFQPPKRFFFPSQVPKYLARVLSKNLFIMLYFQSSGANETFDHRRGSRFCHFVEWKLLGSHQNDPTFCFCPRLFFWGETKQLVSGDDQNVCLMDAGHWSSLSRKPCVERFLAHKRRVTSLKVSPDVREQLVPWPWGFF